MSIPNPCKVAVLATHPIHYQIQLYRRLAAFPDIDLTFLFCSKFGLTRQVDHTSGTAHKWYDETILDGCQHKFLKNYSWEPTPSSVWGTINPGVWPELARQGYRVLIVQGYAGITEWMALAAARTKSLRVLFRGETCFRPASSPLKAAARRLAVQGLSESVDIFLPIGTRSREFYVHYGIPADRMVLSPYAVNNSFFISQAELLGDRKKELKIRLGIPQDLPIVLVISKLIPRKRPLDVIKAFAKLQEHAFLVFVGDGPLRPEIENYAQTHAVKNVLCAGFRGQEGISEFYAIADVFVLASEFETWGLVVNEAMCFSLPIVTTKGVAGSADLVTPNNGYVYEPGDIESLHSAMRELVFGERLRADMGRQSRRIIQDWDQNAAARAIHRGISMALNR